jgi:serine/threonine protein kinase
VTLHPTRRLQDGRYILLGLLRTGGEAEVWRALDTVAGEQRALKVWLAADGGAEAAARELELARRLVHPHVVRVDDAFVDGDHAFVVMELAEGSLAERVATMGPLTPDEAFAALEGPLQALEAAHAAGIVHRDVKPHNLLVFGALDGAFDGALDGDGGGQLTEGGGPRAVVKLADFGIAQVRAEGLTRTRSGAFLGSLPFMSPEQRRDPRNVGPATDVYAAAVTLAWLVTGKAPGDLYLPETLAELRGELRGRGLEKGEIERVVGVVEAGGRLEADQRIPVGMAERPSSSVRMSFFVWITSRTPRTNMAALAVVAFLTAGSTLVADRARTGSVRDDVLPICEGWSEGLLRRYPTSGSDPEGLKEAVAVTAGDIDGDGFIDAAWSHTLGAALRITWGTGKPGLWDGITDIPSGRAQGPPLIADLDQDGRMEVAVSVPEESAIVVQRMRGRAPDGPLLTMSQASIPGALGATDWNGDGRVDLLVQLDQGRTLAVRLGDGGLSFRPHMDVARTEGLFAVVRSRTRGDHVLFARGPELWRLRSGENPEPQTTTPFTRIGSISLVGEDVVVLGAKSDPYRWSALVYPNQQWNEPCRLQQDVSSGYAADLDGDRRVDILTPLSCAYCTSNYGTITPD